MSRISRGILRLFRWRVVGDVPPVDKMVVIGAPHTSNWDFPIALLAASALRIDIRWLGKHTLFRWPVRWLMQLLGGIPVDRNRAGGIVGDARRAFETEDHLVLAIAPEGTRSAQERWKSGFYRIARAAGVPVLLAALDGGRREVRIGPLIELTGEVDTDMDRIRTFYEGARGVKESNESQIRLPEENL